jgi:hypothetical protein
MKCRFCEAEESCFVELVAWDAQRQRARELLLQGLCAMHAGDMPEHGRDPSVFELHPAFQNRLGRLAILHAQQFETTETVELRFGQRYFRLDSPEGAMVRAARDKAIDRSVAVVHDGAAPIEIERVPDLAALNEVISGWTKD